MASFANPKTIKACNGSSLGGAGDMAKYDAL